MFSFCVEMRQKCLTSRVFDRDLHRAREDAGTANSGRRVLQLVAAYSHEARADIYGFRRRGRRRRLALAEWLRSSQSVCASVCPPGRMPVTHAVNVIVGQSRIFENTVEVGGAELKWGQRWP